MPDFKNFNLNVRTIANILLFGGFLVIVLLIGSQNKNPTLTKKPPLDSRQFQSQVQASCQKNQSYDCYVTAFKKVYDEAGPKVMLDSLQNLSTKDNFVKRDCHPYAHEMGRYAFNKIGNALKAFSYGSTICASGYLHGVMEGFLTQTKRDKKDLKAEIVNLCDAKKDDTRFMQFQCLHGMGHGLTMYFEGDIMKSLPYCSSLKDGWDRSSCYGGVFMENIVAKTIPGHKSLYLKEDQPEYPCNIVKDDQKFSCYYLISSWFLQITKYDYKAAFDLCDGVNKDYVWVCYQSMGRDISGVTLRNPDESITNCNLGKQQNVNDCLIGVVKDFTNTTAKPDEAAVFCKKVPDGAKKLCYSAAGQVLADIYPNKADFNNVCQQLTLKEPSFKKACLQES